VINAALHAQGVALGRMTMVSQLIRDKRLVTPFGHQQRLARAFHAIFARAALARRRRASSSTG